MKLRSLISRKLKVSSLLTLFTILLTLTSLAGTQIWDFEKNADGWKVANGNWQVIDGFYQVSQDVDPAHSLVGENDWSNYTIETKIRIDLHHWAGIVFRAKSEMEYYVYYLNVPDNKTELWKHTAGAWTNRVKISDITAAGGIKITNGEWIDVKVKVDGQAFSLQINDEKQSEDNDASYAEGQVGIWAWKTTASFDDFTIQGDKIKDPFTIEPQKKLTIAWAHLKQDN